MNRMRATAQGPREIAITRAFAALPDKLWPALTQTRLMRQWMTSDFGALKSLTGTAAVGDQHHFIWDSNGADMHVIVTYELLDAPRLIRHRETWPDFGAMENVSETRLIPAGDGTELRMTITFASREARDQALTGGMTEGMEAIYANLDNLLAG